MRDPKRTAVLLRLIRRLRMRLSVTHLLRAGCAGLWWSALALVALAIVAQLWLPLPWAFGLLLAAAPLLASLVIGALRGRQPLGQVTRLADRRLRAEGLLLSAWDLARAPGQGGSGVQSLVLGRAMTALPVWQSAIRREFPIARPQMLSLAVLANAAAFALFLSSGAPPGVPADGPWEAGRPSLPQAFEPAPSPFALADAAPPAPARDAPDAGAVPPAAGRRPGDNADPAADDEDPTGSNAASARQATAGRPVAVPQTAMTADPLLQTQPAPTAEQVGSIARAEDAAGTPAAAIDLRVQFLDIERQSMASPSAAGAMPGRELGMARQAPVGRGVPNAPPPARPPQLPAARNAAGPALQAFVADFLAETQAMGTP